MSSNRLIYDTCAYKHNLQQSVGPLEYVLNPIKFENCNKISIHASLYKTIRRKKYNVIINMPAIF